MARLTEDEKQQLLRATAAAARSPAITQVAAANVAPPPRRLTPLEYIEFATFAAQFDRSVKPVAFGGEHWKL